MYSNIYNILCNNCGTMFQNFHFDGYVLEIWNQFVLTGVDTQIVVSLIQLIAQQLKNNNLDIILAVPPSRG